MLTIHDEPIPIEVDKHGVARVGGTRVTLMTVITAYKKGSTPEQIVEDFPTLKLDDVYATITYYLRHREEVENYLEEQIAAAEVLRTEMEQNHPEIFELEKKMRELKARRRE